MQAGVSVTMCVFLVKKKKKGGRVGGGGGVQQGCDAKLGARTGSAIRVPRVEFIVQELPPKYLFSSSALNIYRSEVTSEVLVVFLFSSGSTCVFQ